MKKINHLGNLPRSVKNVVLVEAMSNLMVKAREGKIDKSLTVSDAIKLCMPQIWEANSIEEISILLAGVPTTEVATEVLIDKINDRYYYVAICIEGSTKLKSEMNDVGGIDAQITELKNGAVYFIEIKYGQYKNLIRRT